SNQARANRTPGHPTDPERQLPADPAKSACVPLPQQHATPKGSAGQPRAIGTPGQAPEGGVGMVTVADDLEAAPAGPVPQLDGIIRAGPGQQAPLGTPPHA